MPSLKDLKVRIGSVKNTQKITKAMKMVAASKLRRAREAAEASRPYATRMETMVQALASGMAQNDSAPLLMVGTGFDAKHLLIIATADRGLCGAFNGSIIRASRLKIRELQSQGKQVGLFFVGRKGYDALKAEYGDLMVGKLTDIAKKTVRYETAESIGEQVAAMVENEGYDVCTIVYNQFVSAIAQRVTWQQLIPLESRESRVESREAPHDSHHTTLTTTYEYEPGEEAILRDLLPRNLNMQIFKALLENSASEQGARMTAMDNASRNAGDMIRKLTLQYNRSRQAAITKELIEIISGAEAV